MQQKMRMDDTSVKQGNVKTNLKEFIITNFLFSDEGIQFNDDDSFLEKGIIDSTGILELIEYLEDTYTITIEDDELIPENLDSINQVEAFITRKLSS